MQVASTTSNGSAAASSGFGIDPAEQKQMFLRLLVTQLQNQDPINPVNNEEFLAQMAQFTSVEQIMTMVEKLDGLAQNATFTKGVSLIGRSVDYVDPNGTLMTDATVEAVSTNQGISRLVLDNGQTIDVDAVVQVR